jgi:hypothetical protein
MAYDFSAGLRLRDPQVTSLIRSFLLTVSVCTSAKLRPFSLDASVSRIVRFDGSKLIRTRLHINLYYSVEGALQVEGPYPLLVLFQQVAKRF